MLCGGGKPKNVILCTGTEKRNFDFQNLPGATPISNIEVSRPETVSLLGKNHAGDDNHANHANHAFSGGVWESLTITIAIDF